MEGAPVRHRLPSASCALGPGKLLGMSAAWLEPVHESQVFHPVLLRWLGAGGGALSKQGRGMGGWRYGAGRSCQQEPRTRSRDKEHLAPQSPPGTVPLGARDPFRD